MAADLGAIIKAVEKIIDLKTEITTEIKKQNDIKTRKKLHAACDKAVNSGNPADLRDLRDMLHRI